MSRQEQELGEITVSKGELTEEEIAKIAWSQVSSSKPQQIRAEEGMGFMIYEPAHIKRVNKLPTSQKEEQVQEIIEDMTLADVVSIREPTASPNALQTQDL